MRIQLLSDLHTEHFSPSKAMSFLDSFDPAGVDVLVLAGDVMSLKFFDEASERLNVLLKKYPKVLYVVGNHEFYGTNPSQVSAVCAKLRETYTSLYIFDKPDVVVIDGQKFVCGSMFYRYQEDNEKYQDWMNDTAYIQDFIPWVYEQNAAFLELAEREVDSSSVVITHYLPSYKCVNERYKNSPLNRFFVCEMDELIERKSPKLFASGHTHLAYDFKIGQTRLVCNPFGYMSEQGVNGFNPNLIIEV